jgi:potassium channel subfamily K
MLQTLVFFFYLGLISLVFSKVEGKSCVDGLYFDVVTILTIGFGDVVPQTSVVKVLTFPFSVIGICLLAQNVTSIVRLLADRSRRRKSSLKRELKDRERRINEQKEQDGGNNEENQEDKECSGLDTNGFSNLKGARGVITWQEALRKIREESWQNEKAQNLRALFTSLFVFFSFWFLGALIFNFVEVGAPPC